MSAHNVPVNLALGTGCLVRTLPDKSSLELVDISQGGGWDDEGINEVDDLRGEHRLDQRRPPNSSDVLGIPSDQHGSRFVLKELEIKLL